MNSGKRGWSRLLAFLAAFLMASMLLAAFPGCGGKPGEETGAEGEGPSEETWERPPDITGIIERIAVPSAPSEKSPPPPGYFDRMVGILEIRAHPSYPSSFQAASVRVNGDTKISNEKDGKKLHFVDLNKGMLVRVWFRGPVLESMPVQAEAEMISVVE